MKIIKEDKKNINKIVSALENGAVLVLATDTVYGLVCDANNEKSLEKIFLIKNRDKSKPLLTFVDSVATAKNIALINKTQKIFLNRVWPGQVTAILGAKKKLSGFISKGKTVGVRIPNYEFLKIVLEKFKKPLAQTSANISGKGANTSITDVIKQFENQKIKPDLIIDSGDLPNREPSIIIDITKEKLKTLRR